MSAPKFYNKWLNLVCGSIAVVTAAIGVAWLCFCLFYGTCKLYEWLI